MIADKGKHEDRTCGYPCSRRVLILAGWADRTDCAACFKAAGDGPQQAGRATAYGDIVVGLPGTYQIAAGQGADGNPIAWRVDIRTGEVSLCQPKMAPALTDADLNELEKKGENPFDLIGRGYTKPHFIVHCSGDDE
jgi:hypothetical protein